MFDGTTTVVPLKKEGFVLQWQPDAAKAYPDDLKDPEGYWVANNLFIITPGFNTSLVPKGTEPNTYQDLLDPKWRGKMAWNGFPTSSGMGGFVGTVLTEMGEEKGKAYLRELAKQNIAPLRGVGARSARPGDRRRISDRAADLQSPRGDQRQEGRAGRLDQDGARDRHAVGDPVHKNAPHPNAAKLLVDFIISQEGQEVFRARRLLTAHPDVPALSRP